MGGLLYMGAACVLAAALLFCWPLHFGPSVPRHKTIDLWFKAGTTRLMRKLPPSSPDHASLMALLEKTAYRRTPAGLFGAADHDPQAERMTIICGDCAITVRADGTVCVDGRDYKMNPTQSTTLVQAVKSIVNAQE